MTLTLHLGVIDIPYADNAGQTTGSVAQILEDRYNILGVFAEVDDQKIADAIASSLGGALKNLMLGQPPTATPLAEAEQDITARMKDFISSQEVERLSLPGVPTQAALDGVNHWFKNPRGKWKGKGKKKKFVKNPPRPSFIDTDTYHSNLLAWFTS